MFKDEEVRREIKKLTVKWKKEGRVPSLNEMKNMYIYPKKKGNVAYFVMKLGGLRKIIEEYELKKYHIPREVK